MNQDADFVIRYKSLALHKLFVPVFTEYFAIALANIKGECLNRGGCNVVAAVK